MLNLKKTIYLIIIIFFSSTSVLIAQMPDWTLVVDIDGNRFYFDDNGKMWTSGKPEFDIRPVSIEGIEYYLNQGIELIKSHYKAEGLTLLKSILALPANNDVIYSSQVTASREINNLIKREGNRFKELNENANILMFKEKNNINLINDSMNYTISIPVSDEIEIISKRNRENNKYKYYGLLLGIRFNMNSNPFTKNKEYSNYDLLLAIDSESFSYPLRKAEKIEEHWRKRLGADKLNREIFNKNDNQIIYLFDDGDGTYSGIEGFFIKTNYGYFLKIITSTQNFSRYKDNIIQIINNFKI